MFVYPTAINTALQDGFLFKNKAQVKWIVNGWKMDRGIYQPAFVFICMAAG
jgi:hypothetical protein